MSTQLILAVVFNVVMATVFLFALVRGGRPERLGVLINTIGFGATTAFRLLFASTAWAPGDIATLVIDLAVGGGFFWLGVTTIRFWPIWSAGFVLANLFMGLFGRLMPNIHLFTYHTGLGIYAYLALGSLALGTFRLPRGAEPHIRNGSRRSWLQHLKETS